MVRDYVIQHLGDEGVVFVIDETQFLKQGKASCGVARQYTGSAGKIANCQIGKDVDRHRYVQCITYPTTGILFEEQNCSSFVGVVDEVR